MAIKLGIFGDSFADINPDHLHDRTNEVWPWAYWLSEKLNAESIIFARSGSAVWYAYERFLEHYQSCDVIIFAYTNYARINGLPELQAGLSFVTGDNYDFISKDDKPAANAVYLASKYLYNENLQKFIYTKVFDEVNQLCKTHNKKLINLLSFEQPNSSVINYKTSLYPCLLNLFEVSKEETKYFNHDKTKPDTRHCHLSPYNNKVLCDIILETLDKTNNYYYDLLSDQRFVYK